MAAFRLGHGHFEILEGELALVRIQLLGLLAVERLPELANEVLEAPVALGESGIRFGKRGDPGLLRLEGRPVFGRQPVQVEIAGAGRHGPMTTSIAEHRHPTIGPPSHSAAVGRGTRRAITRRQSSPSTSASNWARDSRITPSCTAGQVKLPCSRRL